MSTAPPVRRLALVVTNPEALQHGSTPRHSFDLAGGTIGGQSADWTLIDKGGRVQPIHSEILYNDMAFCVIDRCGQTRINDAGEPLGNSVAARLNDGDILHVGPYRVAVHLHESQHSLPDASRHLAQYDVGELLSAQAGVLDGLPEGEYRFDPDATPGRRDPVFHALGAPHDDHGDRDPLRALDAAERAAAPERVVMDPQDVRRGGALAPTQADLATTRHEAFTGSPQPPTGDARMPPSRDRSLSGARAPGYRLSNRQALSGDPNQATAPLLQGLDVPLGPLDAQAGYTLLLEAGQALNAAIRGIAELYGTQAGSQQRLSLLGRTLQPIEDNPLRLGQDYPDTVRALFSQERSVVHLSPKAAIDESLAQLRAHHGAVIHAIQASLDALLRAFSPDLLLQRFKRYRPDQAADAGADDWAWRMYTHYYEELASARQRGFEKLFWEVFEQAYDRVLRAEAP